MTRKGIKPNKQALALRRAQVSEMYLQGITQVEIANRLNFTQPVISNDLKVLRGEWLERSAEAINEKKALELAKIDQLELTYWAAWERSKQPKESVMRERTGAMAQDKDKAAKDGDTDDAVREVYGAQIKETRRREGQVGNPAFLDGVMKCIDKRCKILGLDAPSRNLNVDLNSMTDEQLEKLAAGADIVDVLSTGKEQE